MKISYIDYKGCLAALPGLVAWLGLEIVWGMTSISPLAAAGLAASVSLAVFNYERASKLAPDRQSENQFKASVVVLILSQSFPLIGLLAQIIILCIPAAFTPRFPANQADLLGERGEKLIIHSPHHFTETKALELMSKLSIAQQQSLEEVLLGRQCLPYALPPELFKHCTHLQKFSCFSSNLLTTLPPELFANCPNLREVYFDFCTSLTTLPAQLFTSCPNLREVNFWSSGLTTLPEELFAHCPNLREVYFSYSDLTALPAGLFSNCPRLQRIGLMGCSSLRELPHTFFELPSGCSIFLSKRLTHSDAMRDKVRAIIQAGDYHGPKFYSLEQAPISLELDRIARRAAQLNQNPAEGDEGVEI